MNKKQIMWKKRFSKINIYLDIKDEKPYAGNFSVEPEFRNFFSSVVFMPFVRIFQDELARKISNRIGSKPKKNNGLDQ